MRGCTLDKWLARALVHEMSRIKAHCQATFQASAAGQESKEYVDLGSNSRASFDSHYGPTCDFRHFWLPPGDMELVPTRRGIKLDLNQLDKLLQIMQEILEMTWTDFHNIPEPCYIEHARQNNQQAFLMCPRCNPLY